MYMYAKNFLIVLGRKKKKYSFGSHLGLVDKASLADVFFQLLCLRTRNILSGHCPSISNS